MGLYHIWLIVGIKNLKKLLTNIPIWNIVANRVSTLDKRVLTNKEGRSEWIQRTGKRLF